MATANENNPSRRIEDKHPDAKIDWTKPEAPAVPLPGTAGAAKGGITSLEWLERYALFPGALIRDPAGAWLRFSDVESYLATQAQEAAPATDLHDAIMNLICTVPESFANDTPARMAYKYGHRDARHAAAELTLAHPAAALEPTFSERDIPSDAPRAFAKRYSALLEENAKLKAKLAAQVEPVAIPAGMPTAQAVADEIMANLDDRNGVLDGVDDEIREEIRDSLAEIVGKALAAAPSPAAEGGATSELPAQAQRDSALRAEPAGQHNAGAAVLAALRDGIPLQEPVNITKAVLAQREARVSLSGGTGPVACAMLVNIQLTSWADGPEKAKAFASGYNTAMKWYRSALLDLAAQAGAAPSEQLAAPEQARRELLNAAINCAHSITDETIILHCHSGKEGNALHQLGNRLNEAFARLAAPTEAQGAARDAVLEEAAKVAEECMTGLGAAGQIRALKAASNEGSADHE